MICIDDNHINDDEDEGDYEDEEDFVIITKVMMMMMVTVIMTIMVRVFQHTIWWFVKVIRVRVSYFSRQCTDNTKTQFGLVYAEIYKYVKKRICVAVYKYVCI